MKVQNQKVLLLQNKLYVSEVFGATIQGEGKRAGKVSLFIRLAKCNMSCSGFQVKYKVAGKTKFGCDSYYAVDTAFKSTWESLNSDEIINKAKKLSKLKNIDIVISGGEPLVYWQNGYFQDILKYFIKNKHFITIETNGSIDIKINKKYQRKVMFSIGLKLQNSNEQYTKRININAINNLLKNSTQSYLKFVVSGKESELKEILEIKNKVNILDNNIYLMPLCSTAKELRKIEKKVVQKAIKYNFNYSDRMHIRLWDNKRKV